MDITSRFDSQRAVELFSRAVPIADAPGEMRWIGTRSAPVFLTLLRSLFDGTPCGVHLARPSEAGAPVFDFLGSAVNVYAELNGHMNMLVANDVDARLALIEVQRYVEGEYSTDAAPPLSLDCPAIWTLRDAGSWDARTYVRAEVSA